MAYEASRFLILKDKSDECDGLIEILTNEGSTVRISHTIDLAMFHGMDIAVLAVAPHRMVSFDTIRSIRQSSDLPLIVLANGSLAESVVALEIGADDYLPRPANRQIFMARARAILRRYSGTLTVARPTGGSLHVGDVELDTASSLVRRNGGEIALTPIEFKLLLLLMSAAGRLVDRAAVTFEILGRTTTRDRAIDAHVCSLRRKLGPITQLGRQRIRTVRGYGFVYTAEPPATFASPQEFSASTARAE